MKKAKACYADGGIVGSDGLTDAQRAKLNGARSSLGVNNAPPPVVQQPVAPPPVQAPVTPQAQGIGAGIAGILKGRQAQIDKAAGYAQGGLIRDAAEYWADDNARFDNSNPSFAGRVIRAVNPLTGFGSAMGAMHTAAGNGDIPGMAMAGISAIPAFGVMRITPASGALKAAAVPSAGRAAGAVSGGAVLNAIADEYQANKPSGYANGGKIEGPGTPTSDSIPAKVRETGEEIAVSTKERIVSHEQDKLLQRLAKAMGFESVDAFFEAGTGKPVGPTIKGGKKAAAGGWSLDNNPDEYAKAMQDTRNAMSIPSLSTNNSAAQGGIYKDVGLPAISMGAGQAPTIYDNGGLPTKTDRVSGSLPVATVSKTAGDGARPWYMQDPLTAISSGIEKSMNASQAAEDYNKSLYPAGTFDSATKPAAQQPVSAAPVSSATQSPVALSAGLSGIMKPGSDANFMTGAKPGEMPSSAQGGFTQGNKSYNVNPTSQQGISRISATGTSPLYTNIKPEDAVAGLKNQTIGQPADEAALGIARIANANKIRGEMIANRDKDIPAGGYAPSILADQSVSDNAALNAMRNSAMVSGLSPSQQAAFLQQQSELALRDKGQGITADVARYGHDVQAQRAAGHDNVLMRGQDLNAKDQAEENANKRETNRLLELKLGQERAPDYSKRYLQAPNRKIYNDMGQVIGEEPGGWFDAASGQMVGNAPQPQQRVITAEQRKAVEAALPKGMAFEQYAKQHNIVVR